MSPAITVLGALASAPGRPLLPLDKDLHGCRQTGEVPPKLASGTCAAARSPECCDSKSAGRRTRSGSAEVLVQQAVECRAVLLHRTDTDAGNRQQFGRSLRAAVYDGLQRLIGEHAKGGYAAALGFGQPPLAQRVLDPRIESRLWCHRGLGFRSRCALRQCLLLGCLLLAALCPAL